MSRSHSSLDKRPLWLELSTAFVAIALLIGAAALGLFGMFLSTLKNVNDGRLANLTANDLAWMSGCRVGAVVCAFTGVALFVWLFKRPNKR